MPFALMSKPRGKSPASEKPLPKRKIAPGLCAVDSEPGFEKPVSLLHATSLSIAPVLQTKLKIGEPNDKFEQEADRVADEVMRMPEPRTLETATISGSAPPTRIQRACPECKEGLSGRPVAIQRMCPECEEELHRQPMEVEETVQAKEISCRTPEVTPDVQAQISGLRGSGQPLPGSVRAFFEPRFGRDFGGVRVHTDFRAASVASQVNARAFTVGHHMVFGVGQYAPQDRAGKNLMAHELTHVLQQSPAQEMSTLQCQQAPIERERHTESDITVRPDQARLTLDFLRGSRQITVEGGLTQPLNLLGVRIPGVSPSRLDLALRFSDRCNRAFQSAVLEFKQNQRRPGGVVDLTRNPWRVGATVGFRTGTVRFDPGFTLNFEGSQLDTVLFVLTVTSGVSDDVPQECIVPPRPEPETEEPPQTHEPTTPTQTPPSATELARSTVYFFYDSTILRAESNNELRQVINILLGISRLRVHLTGHASLEGTDQYNLRLGQRRANTIRDLLVLGGVEAGRISAVSAGEFAPAEPEPPIQQRTLLPSIENIRNQNRRVEILFVDPHGEYAPTSAQPILRTLEFRRPELGTRLTLGTTRLHLEND